MNLEKLIARAASAESKKLLFTEARTKQFFLDKPVTADKLKEMYDLWKFGPTAMNCCPLRVVFVQSKEAKAKLEPLAMDTNREKIRLAPVTAILAYDAEFYEKLPALMPPYASYANVLRGDQNMAAGMGKLNATLEAGYFIIAARSVGLDAGPMGGFSNDGVDQAFFAGETGERKNWKSLILVNLGYGDDTKVYPRAPRLTFDEACLVE